MSEITYIIRDGAVVADEWKLIPAAEDTATAVLPTGKVIVPLKVWLALPGTAQRGPIGVWLDGHDDASLLADSINQIAVIAVNFPKFADGADIRPRHCCAPAMDSRVNCAPLATCSATNCSTCSAWVSMPSRCGRTRTFTMP